MDQVAGIPQLQCTEDVQKLAREAVVYSGFNQPMQVLRANELLYLVLIFLDNAMVSSVVDGFGSLYPLRFDPVCSNERYECPSAHLEYYDDMFDRVNGKNALSLDEAIQFNKFMDLRTDAEIACTSQREIDLQAETNPHSFKLRECREELQEDVGWEVPSNEPNNVIEVQVHADVLLQGFYPSFLEHLRESSFVQTLSSKRWTEPANTPVDMHICYTNAELGDSHGQKFER